MCGANAFAEEGTIVQRQVDLEFVPESAFFILQDDTVTKQAADAWVQNSENKQWVFGVYHKPVKASALLVFGAAGETAFFPFEAQDETFSKLSLDSAKELLREKNEVLDSIKVQLRVQNDTLERLRSDAEVIGNLGRITEKTSEYRRLKGQIENLNRDIENLNSFIEMAGKGEDPRNFAARQTMLTEQLDQIVKAAQAMETGERSRRNKGESDLQRDLHLLEITRDDNYDELKAELQNLRRQRVALEGGSNYGNE